MKELWNKRYSIEDYVYGTKPNQFFKESLEKYSIKGKILFPAEGEGRNCVYAAKMGLEAFAFDVSENGKKKALKLAATEGVKINYEIGNFFDLQLVHQKYDAAVLIFSHFPLDVADAFNKKISELIKPDGYIILEGFSKSHAERQKTNPNAGGPKNIELLFSMDSVKKDFPDFEAVLLEEREIELNEGLFHKGMSSVIRFIGRKMV